VIELPTGAWYNPADPNVDNSLEIHGNPNILTLDVGYEGEVYPVTAFDLPEIIEP